MIWLMLFVYLLLGVVLFDIGRRQDPEFVNDPIALRIFVFVVFLLFGVPLYIFAVVSSALRVR